MIITIVILFDLPGRKSASERIHIWKGCFEFWLKEKKIPLFLSFFCTPTNLATWNGQSQCEVAFLRYSHTLPPTPVMGPSSHSCKLNPWCHFLLDDVMWWDCDCVAWRGVDLHLNSFSLYSALLLYILYIVSWQFVECSKLMPFLAGTCCSSCNWRADWLVGYTWKWP